MFINPENRLSIKDINLPSNVGREISRRSARSMYSMMDQRKRANSLVANNLSEEKIARSGFSTGQLSSLIQDDPISEELRSEYSEKFNALKQNGIDIADLRNRYLQQIEDERLKGENDRISAVDKVVGMFQGYLIDDPINLTANLAGGLVTLSRKGLTLGGKALYGAVENALVESALTKELDISLEEKAKAVAFAGLAGGALPIAGAGISKAYKSVRNIFDGTTNSKAVASKLKTEIAAKTEKQKIEDVMKGKTSGSKQILEEVAEDLELLGGRADKALNLRVEIEDQLSKGLLNRSSKLERVYYVDLPGGKKVEASNLESFQDSLRTSLREMNEFSEDQIDDTVFELTNQRVVGEFDTYKVLTEDVPLPKQKNIKRKRLDGSTQEIKDTVRPLVFETLEEADAKLGKIADSAPDAEVVRQNNGKFAIVQVDDTISQLEGTTRFATKKKAQEEIPEYAERFGLDESDLTVTSVPSRAFDAKPGDVDYVVSHLGSARAFNEAGGTGNEFLDTLVLKTEKRLVTDLEYDSVNPARYKQVKEDARKIKSASVDEAALSADQLAIRTDNVEIKRLNANLKSKKELFDKIKGCF